MPLEDMLILTAPPYRAAQLRSCGVTQAHTLYRVGRGAHLLRAGPPAQLRGGVMALDLRGFDGRGDPTGLCQELGRECAARSFSGVLLDCEQGIMPLSGQTIAMMDESLARRGLELYVPECCGDQTTHARVMVGSALSGGSLAGRLECAITRFGGPRRVVLRVERVAEDFFLPAPEGSGRPLSQGVLSDLMARLKPCVFFSDELCERYFTYMTPGGTAHFVLFDDGGTIRKKLTLARRLGIDRAVANLGESDDLLDEILK